MDDWDDEHIPSLSAKVDLESKWDDEDVDENEIKDSWEEDDEPAQPPVVKPASEKKAAEKGVDRKGKAIEVPESSKGEALDAVAEKLRQQRLVEEADYQSTTELFGEKSDGKNLDLIIPKSESDFLEYAELISHRLVRFEKSFCYNELLKSVMRLSVANMKAAEVKDIASSITTIVNEKLKAEKDASTSTRRTRKKKQLQVDKPDDDLVAGPYDAMDDDDFM